MLELIGENSIWFMKGGSFYVETVVDPGSCDFKEDGVVVRQHSTEFGVDTGPDDGRPWFLQMGMIVGRNPMTAM